MIFFVSCDNQANSGDVCRQVSVSESPRLMNNLLEVLNNVGEQAERGRCRAALFCG